MKKAYWILIVLLCSVFSILLVDLRSKAIITANIEKATYDNNIYTRNCSDYAMEQIIDENAIVVLGSSELGNSNSLAYPPDLFNYGYSNFNMILMGGGYLQSIAQAVNVGALANNIKNGKVVLILSPQWFEKKGLASKKYCSRFEEANFIEFLRNDSISKETRFAVANRMNELLTADPPTLERVKKDEQIYLNNSLKPLNFLEMTFYNAFRAAKLRYQLADEFKSLDNKINYENYVDVHSIDWDSLMAGSEVIAEGMCTTNEFGVYDNYFNEHIRDGLDESKGQYASKSYTTSPEFDDFRLFLDVCKETGIEPLVISVPVNGRWYDYCGFSKADRNTYYQMIRDICEEYEVTLADYSDKEYELYFLKDVMHMGWKGWVYLDRAIYSFCNNEAIIDTTNYKLLTPVEIHKSDGVEEIFAGKYELITDVADNEFNCMVVSLRINNTVIDRTSSIEHRSGTYLHVEESGNYVIRARANSNKKDEYVEFTYYLEKDKVYKLEYEVDLLQRKKAAFSCFAFYELTF